MESARLVPVRWQRIAFWIIFATLGLLNLGTLLWEQPIYRIFGKAIGTKVEWGIVNGGIVVATQLGALLLLASALSLAKPRWIRLGKRTGIGGVLAGMIGVFTGCFWIWMMMSGW